MGTPAPHRTKYLKEFMIDGTEASCDLEKKYPQAKIETKMKVYISDGTWFDKGTEAKLIGNVTESSGIFKGIKDGSPDEEVCGFDEFHIEDKDEFSGQDKKQ